ncbi:MAG TPA: LLM class F420-dependent oxidoreductase [Acidimicrobiales bacterium]|jgi:probable F420-dependent oxidoreductase
MRFSVTYPIIDHSYDRALLTGDAIKQFVQAAERVGFDGVGFTDHPAPTAKWLHSGGHDALDPFVALSYCAAVTERIRLIPNIVVLAYRHPLLVGKMVATLDALSGGRFTLAVAAGYLRGEYKALGIDFDQRNDLFDQSLSVLRGIWTDDNFEFDGIGIEAHGLDANPKPNPHPPIWIGGNSKRARRRVAQAADGWTPFPAARERSQTTKTPPLETLEDLAGMIEELRQFVDEAGRPQSAIDIAFGSFKGGSPGSGSFDPDLHREGVDELAQLGVTWTHTGVPGGSLAEAIEALEQYGETVIGPSRS